MRAFVVTGVLAAGCTAAESTRIPMQVANTGSMCLHAREPQFPFLPQPFATDAPVYVRIELDACLSSSCDVDRAASCSIAVTGSTFAVTSIGTWTTVHDERYACTADCGLLSATCLTDPLPAGTHTFSYGDRSLVLEVPSSLAAPPCLP